MKQNMNIVVPMAGRGSRFREAGYTDTKPFIDVNGKPISDSISNKIHQVKIRVNSIREKEHPKVLIIFVF